MVWTLGGYAQDFIKRQLNHDIFDAHKDKLTVTFITSRAGCAPPDANEELKGIAIVCPVSVKIQGYAMDELLSKLKEQLALPIARWNISKSDEEGCVKLGIFVGYRE